MKRTGQTPYPPRPIRMPMVPVWLVILAAIGVPWLILWAVCAFLRWLVGLLMVWAK